MNSKTSLSRRRFLHTTTAATVASWAVPNVRAQNKSGTKVSLVGTGPFTYECDHGFGQLPSNLKWGETHGVTVDGEGFVYVKHNTATSGLKHQDAIVVFDPTGKFVRSFGDEYSGSGHGIDLRKEGTEEFLYLSSFWGRNCVTKTTLNGEIVWTTSLPWESGVYDEKKNFVPTNVAFAPDGGFFIADGYGSNYIHKYNKDGKWLKCWGGTGTEPGKFKTPHGLAWDNRKNQLCVCDRANARLQYFDADGRYLSEVTNLLFPAHLDTRGDVMLCPDLHARVTLFDKDNQVIVHLGDDAEWRKLVLDGFKIRSQPDKWVAGKFVHPHDACFDQDGNIYIVEWVTVGRVTKLKKVG
ncbi:MAG TPA: peptidase [Verrucomicrobiota bacterium]|nr:peptidase [Verrucomicrobiales bacterium]HRI15718.1 peptidase [Verrucomicrobiota bacterium]